MAIFVILSSQLKTFKLAWLEIEIYCLQFALYYGLL